ncbi:zinc-binding alcohol dehydrogenase family protein [Dactylosporangium sp. NPDC049140]|uniref:quinone oxidoreductase family protein n=1 Tax=Dactylosporangium sp. NPDC049140 TaxID=3155647 RepID=UPI0033CB8B1B
MYAAVVHEFASPPHHKEIPDPQPADGTVLARVEASAVHQIVRLIASGRHYSGAARPPFVPGIDGVVRLPDGRRVYTGGLPPPYGMLAELAAVRPQGIAVPDGLSSAVAAAIVNPAQSSWLPLTAHLAPGATVLVLGATGVSGSLAVQAARLKGAARVIAAGRNAAGLQRCRELGADAAVELGDGFADRLRHAAPDGVDLVLDYLWGPAALAALAALDKLVAPSWRETRWLQIGSAAGASIEFDAALVRSRNLRLSGHGIGSGDPAAALPAIAEVLQAAAEGRLTIDLESVPLRDIEQTWDRRARLVYEP